MNSDALNEQYQKLYQELENDNYEAEQDVYDLEQQVNEELSYAFGKEKHALQSLLHKIKTMKKEFDFYDEEAELDMMFPNRHDEDFDEDDMSYDSVFGDD